MQKRLGVLVAVLALLGASDVSMGAQSTDFSGIWELDTEASTLPQGGFGRGGGGGPQGGGRGRGPGGFGGGAGATATVVITQTADALVMEQQGGNQSRIVTYQLDGNESTNTTPRGDTITVSRWDGAALVTEGSQSFETPRGAFTMEMREHRSLSADNQTLTVESARTTPRGEVAVTLVYRRSTS